MSDGKFYPGLPQGKQIIWEDGMPVPIYNDPLNVPSMKELAITAVSTQYTGDVDPETGETVFEERFQGSTLMEVTMVRLAEQAATGNLKAAEMIMDRILGKPKQQVESVSVRMSYDDYLMQLAKEEGMLGDSHHKDLFLEQHLDVKAVSDKSVVEQMADEL